MIYFKSHVEVLLRAKDETISVLQRERDRLLAELELENRRANTAVDRLLNQARVLDITPPVVRERPDVDEILRSVHAAVKVGQDVTIKEEGD